MQLNDIIAMCNAGFSAKQIASMVELETKQIQQTAAAPQQIQQTAAAPQQIQQTAAAPQQIQQTAAAPQQIWQTAAAPQQIRQTAAAPQQIPNTQQQFNEILAAIRGSNLNAAEQPQQQTSDQILASIINPPTKKEV